jgi:hypothetical protein
MYLFRLKLNINSCISFQSNYNPFQFNLKNDLFYYGSTNRKIVKKKFGLIGLVEDHHIIPKSFEKHPLLVETKFHVHCSKNIKMMPSRDNTDISDNILIHCHHRKYNYFIKERLNEIYETNDNKETKLIMLLNEMEEKLNYKDLVPWN